MVNIGDQAPDFSLPDKNGKVKNLKDYRGSKTVLAFFPGAFTSVCTTEMCTFRDVMAKFSKMNAKIVGISVDAPFSLAEFAKQNRIEFDLLSDSNKEVVSDYEVMHENFAGINGLKAAKRSVFVLDPEGIVRYRWVSENPGVEPDYSEIDRELEKL